MFATLSWGLFLFIVCFYCMHVVLLLLDKNNTNSDDMDGAILIKHSPYFSETSFINLLASDGGLTVSDLNVCNAFTKFDKLELFIESQYS